MNELQNWLEGLELAETKNTIEFAPRGADVEGLESTGEDQAVINFKSVQSFVAGLSVSRQEDVLNSLLLAQRAATKAFPAEEQLMQWHSAYFDVLEKLGWVFSNKGFESFKCQNNLFEIDKVLLEVLGTVLTGNQLAIILKSIEALKSLGDNDERFKAFERNTHSVKKGNFQLGVAEENNNSLTISSTAFIIDTKKSLTKILFFSSEKDSTELKYAYIHATLNDARFGPARESIRNKLGDTSKYVADLEI